MLIFLYNFHREHSLLKSIIKKLSPKINVKNKKSSLELVGQKKQQVKEAARNEVKPIQRLIIQHGKS